ncbi:MAG: xanthine dehydrogenase family protein subunit M [Dehalococcoidia bacterium]|nr:xanthine dehydrogenase family protein subunit M [Dehalococcoidia bacterium]
MQPFSFHRPTSLDETFSLLEQHGDEARMIAGGTALVVMMKQSLFTAEHLISLDRVPGLSGIRGEADGLHIGALTRHRELEMSPVVRSAAPFLAEVYSHVATVRIRNQATVGGGLAHADPNQDPPAAFITLEARVKLVSRNGERLVPVAELFSDYYETVIQPGELLTEVIVPPVAPGTRTAYLKFLPRTEDDYATVAVGATAQMQGGVVQKLKVALIAAAPTALSATVVEDQLVGKSVTPAAIRQAAEAVEAIVDPLDDFRGSSSYKRDMAVVFTRRALERVLQDGA